jgi:pyrroloquinoline quinone biosynthesis protein E
VQPFPDRVTWSRPEPFGAWVRFGDGLLLAVDHALAAKLGVPEGRALSAEPAPLEVHIAVTSRCYAPCPGCYLDARPDGADVPFEELAMRIRAAREAGASTVAFGGGEPLLRDDLPRLAALARSLDLVPVLTTSGAGLTAARAAALRDFAQINVSHDGAGAAYEAVRGYDGASVAERALALLGSQNIPAGVNVVVTRATAGALSATAERVADLGAMELQLLRYKPAGRAASPAYAGHRLTADQVAALWPAIGQIVATRRLRVRIDCAMVPLLSPALVAAGVDTVRALGVFGCEAARNLGAREASGAAAPCSFLRGTSPESLRAYHAALPAPCDTCSLAAVCRGGCQAVSLHERGRFAPDPECPRVLAFQSAAAAERDAAMAHDAAKLPDAAAAPAPAPRDAVTPPDMASVAGASGRRLPLAR